MAEDQEDKPLKEEATKVVRESRADLFLRKAREARARYGIETVYSPNTILNERTDTYLHETVTNAGDRMTEEQKEFLGTLLFTAAEKEGKAEWVSTGDRRIDDKSLDEARLAGLLVVDGAEHGQLPAGMRAHARALRMGIGRLTGEQREASLMAIEAWKKQAGRTPLELKAYEEWEKRWKLVERYNQQLRLSEEIPETPEPVVEGAQAEPQRMSRRQRWNQRFIGFGRQMTRFGRAMDSALGIPPVPEEGQVGRAAGESEERPIESGLSRAMASLAERNRDAVAWGNARLASQRATLEERIGERLQAAGKGPGEGAEAGAVEGEEAPAEWEAQAAQEEEGLPEGEKQVLEEAEKQDTHEVAERLRDLANRIESNDEPTRDKALAELGYFWGRAAKGEPKAAEPASPKKEPRPETGKKGKQESAAKPAAKKESQEAQDWRSFLKTKTAQEFLRRVGKTPEELTTALDGLAAGKKGLKEFAEEFVSKGEEDSQRAHKMRRVFYDLLRKELVKRGHEEGKIENTELEELQRIVNQALEGSMEKDWSDSRKREFKKNFWMAVFFNTLEELKASAAKGLE